MRSRVSMPTRSCLSSATLSQRPVAPLPPSSTTKEYLCMPDDGDMSWSCSFAQSTCT
jgi:hypothetical protein